MVQGAAPLRMPLAGCRLIDEGEGGVQASTEAVKAQHGQQARRAESLGALWLNCSRRCVGWRWNRRDAGMPTHSHGPSQASLQPPR